MLKIKKQLIFSFLALWLFIGHNAQAAIVFDAASVSGACAGCSALPRVSWNHTTGSISDGILVCTVGWNAGATVSTFTYGGVSLTQVPGAMSDFFGVMRTDIWYLKNPASGTHAIALTMTGGNSADLLAGCSTYSGVDQTTPFGTAANTAGSNTGGISVNVSSATGELVIGGATMVPGDDSTIAPGAGVTQQWLDGSVGITSAWRSTGGDIPGAGIVTIGWTWTGNSISGMSAVPLKPAGGGPPPSTLIKHRSTGY